MSEGAGATAGIILIGDELLSGKVVDENAAFLTAQLRELGVALRRVIVIPDVLDEIAATVRDFSARFDHVFTSGGVGPTHDDLTMAGVAQAFGQKIARHPELEKALRDHYGARLEERNLRMADVPDGVCFVPGDHPRWPVLAVANVYVLPGIPELFRSKFLAIAERFRGAPFFLRSVYVAEEEGKIAGALDAVVAAFPSVQVGSYPRWQATDHRVRVTLEGRDAAEVERATGQLVAALGTKVVRTG